MKSQQGLNANHLKLIAIFAMTIDHICDLLYPGFPTEPVPIILHILGRLTAPIMWFFVCEGYYYTHNVKKYMLRMGVFALISHFAYCFAFGINMIPFSTGIFNQTSVMYPLFIAIVVMWMRDNELPIKKWLKTVFIVLLILSAFFADWSCVAVFAVLGMYKHRGNLKKQMAVMLLCVAVYSAVSFLFVNKAYALVQIGVLLVYPFLRRYNGERGSAKWMKWFFYVYYPLHLVVIGICRVFIYGNIGILF